MAVEFMREESHERTVMADRGTVYQVHDEGRSGSKVVTSVWMDCGGQSTRAADVRGRVREARPQE